MSDRSAAARKAWDTIRAKYGRSGPPRRSAQPKITTTFAPCFPTSARPDGWSAEMQDATPAQFRRLLPRQEMDPVIKLATYAGIRMAEQLAKVGNTVPKLDETQIETWRRRFAVPANRVTVMTAVAWAVLHFPWRHRQQLNARWVLEMKGGFR